MLGNYGIRGDKGQGRAVRLESAAMGAKVHVYDVGIYGEINMIDQHDCASPLTLKWNARKDMRW